MKQVSYTVFMYFLLSQTFYCFVLIKMFLSKNKNECFRRLNTQCCLQFVVIKFSWAFLLTILNLDKTFFGNHQNTSLTFLFFKNAFCIFNFLKFSINNKNQVPEWDWVRRLTCFPWNVEFPKSKIKNKKR